MVLKRHEKAPSWRDANQGLVFFLRARSNAGAQNEAAPRCYFLAKIALIFPSSTSGVNGLTM